MAFGSMLNKAKDVASKASDATKDVASKADDVTKDVTSKAKDTVAKAGEVTKKVGDIINKVTDIINNLNEAFPILAENGYTITELEVEIGMIPKVVSNFNVPTEEISQEKKDEILAKLENNKLASMIVNSLFQASKIQTYIKAGNLKIAKVEIEASIPPTVKIKFQ